MLKPGIQVLGLMPDIYHSECAGRNVVKVYSSERSRQDEDPGAEVSLLSITFYSVVSTEEAAVLL